MRDPASAPEEAGHSRLRPMRGDDLDAVMAIEAGAYSFPWSRGNFTDSLMAGYWMEVLQDPWGRILGYDVAMMVLDELHLLNLTVDPACRRRGHAHALLDGLESRALRQGLKSLWLEVRASNAAARALYASRGFVERGLRRRYYPAGNSRREDAVIMALALGPSVEDGDAAG